MDKFTVHTGVAAPLRRNNIDTDTIIPSREMKTVSKTGLADGLFAPWRYLDAKTRQPNPEFVLNQAAHSDASVLISGDNFGCGSSREHAVWALKEYGIRCIIAEGFGNIFFRNCVRNGILPITLASPFIGRLISAVEANPKANPLNIDLVNKTIHTKGLTISFTSEESDRQMLLQGLDQIALTQQLQSEIDRFREHDSRLRPWVY